MDHLLIHGEVAPKVWSELKHKLVVNFSLNSIKDFIQSTMLDSGYKDLDGFLVITLVRVFSLGDLGMEKQAEV
uniref:Uncharacterized protein n=1 Tax=Kalanchoe fedtschenkoi TaxID=63787 RepID=A0A7N0UEZ4_KALFE